MRFLGLVYPLVLYLIRTPFDLPEKHSIGLIHSLHISAFGFAAIGNDSEASTEGTAGTMESTLCLEDLKGEYECHKGRAKLLKPGLNSEGNDLYAADPRNLPN